MSIYNRTVTLIGFMVTSSIQVFIVQIALHPIEVNGDRYANIPAVYTLIC